MDGWIDVKRISARMDGVDIEIDRDMDGVTQIWNGKC